MIKIGMFFFSVQPWKFFYKKLGKNFWQFRIGFFQVDCMEHKS